MTERPICGAWMPKAQEHCARTPGHGPERRFGRIITPGHRTRWAMDNARDMASGIGWRTRERATA